VSDEPLLEVVGGQDVDRLLVRVLHGSGPAARVTKNLDQFLEKREDWITFHFLGRTIAAGLKGSVHNSCETTDPFVYTYLDVPSLSRYKTHALHKTQNILNQNM
jgi:hypothetical protein